MAKVTDIRPDFDIKLVAGCAESFTGATGLGCTVSSVQGDILHKCGYSCASCRLCALAGGKPKTNCVQANIYGLTSAERFGGKYIYYCPLGLTCFVSPILGPEGGKAQITVGPFLMVDMKDFIQCDLRDTHKFPETIITAIEAELAHIPIVFPEKVDALSSLLFMTSAYLNDATAIERMRETQQSDKIQGQITPYIMRLKSETNAPPYPYDTEQQLLRAVGRGDKVEARKFLNEMFGYIFFAAGGNLSTTKARIYEILVLINRAAVVAGVNLEHSLKESTIYFETMQGFKRTEDICNWLYMTMEHLMDSIFEYSGEKHAHVIRKTLAHLRVHYSEKITLGDIAKKMYLSPVYFSRIFKQETDTTFIQCLNAIRIAKSRELICTDRYRLTDISLMVGFEDQSYFTKVFKRVTGMSPMQYKEGLPELKG